ncbi:MAG: NAD+ synthase, partial [Methylophilaceae bacterium]
ALVQLSAALTDITVIVGHPHQVDDVCYNAASVLQDGKILATYHKHALPNYSVFDEKRYFAAGSEPLIFEHQNIKIGVLICADVWEPAPALLAKQAGAELLISINASPFHLEKHNTRLDRLRDRTVETKLPIIYANMVGGQDELVFDGGSFVLNSTGNLTHHLPAFEATLAVLDFNGSQPISAVITPHLSVEASVYNALKLGLHDYVRKNGFPGVVLGLSGGVDSALTMAIAVDALGAQNVHAVMMPSEFTADISVNDAREMANILGVKYSEIAIKPMYEAYTAALAPQFGSLPFDATEENLQARIRGMLLMALSNKFGSIVVTTGNKSEMAVGYCTLYGDMAGGFAVLKDVPKTAVYRLARWRNRKAGRALIPEATLRRAPTAELRHGQKDQDTLPPYPQLDAILKLYIEEDRSVDEIVGRGHPRPVVRKVAALVDRNEYKRRQAPPGVKITPKAFGRDRRMPISGFSAR